MMRVLRWPQEIPKSSRTALDTGHRSFCLQRTHFGPQALLRQQIFLTGHVLIAVAAGGAIIERGPERHLIEAGGYALVPSGLLEITELPVEGCTYGEIYYFFLNTEVLRDRLHDTRSVQRLALGMTPWPSEVGVTPGGLNRIQEVMAMGGAIFPHQFAKVLTVLINQTSAPSYSFFASHFFLPRLRINLFMEQRVMDPMRSDEGYPGGSGQMIRDLRSFMGLTPEEWLRKRRAELATAWIFHGTVRAEQLEKLGKEFEDPIRRALKNKDRYRASRARITPYFRRSHLVPFWMPAPEPVIPPIGNFFGAGTMNPLASNIPQPAVAQGSKAEKDYWNATSTLDQVGNIIRAQFGTHSAAAAIFEGLEQQAA